MEISFSFKCVFRNWNSKSRTALVLRLGHSFLAGYLGVFSLMVFASRECIKVT